MSVILNVAFAGAYILSVASTEGSALELAFLAVYFVISIKTEFQTTLKSDILHNQSMARLKFSKNCLNILMEQQFQDFFLVFFTKFITTFSCK